MARVKKYFRDKDGYYCFHTKEGNLIKCLSLQGVKIQLHNFKN